MLCSWPFLLVFFITPVVADCDAQEVSSWTCHPSMLSQRRDIKLIEYKKIAHVRPETIHWQKIWLRSSDFGDWSETDCRFYTFFPKNTSLNLVVSISGLYLYQTLNFKTCKNEPCAFLLDEVWRKCPVDISTHLKNSEYSIGFTKGFYSSDLQKNIQYVTSAPGKTPSGIQFVFFDKHLLDPTGFVGLVLTSKPVLTEGTMVVYPKNHTTGTLDHHPSFRMMDFVFDHSPLFFIWNWLKPFIIYAWDFFQDFNIVMPIFSIFYLLYTSAVGSSTIGSAMALVTSIFIHQQGYISW